MKCLKCGAAASPAVGRCGTCFASLSAGTTRLTNPRTGEVSIVKRPRTDEDFNVHSLISGIIALVQVALFFVSVNLPYSAKSIVPFLMIPCLLLTIGNFFYSGYAFLGRVERRGVWMGRLVFFLYCCAILTAIYKLIVRR